jgi:hypothetical protein
LLGHTHKVGARPLSAPVLRHGCRCYGALPSTLPRLTSRISAQWSRPIQGVACRGAYEAREL